MPEGGCDCDGVRHRLPDAPMIVRCCHCRWCQRETGSAFVLNAVIEQDRLDVTAGVPEMAMTPSASGKGQEIACCPTCRVALWSHYGGSRWVGAFVRCGALNDPAAVTPDVHIFTDHKLPWLNLPEDVPAFAGFYADPAAVWRPDARRRWAAMLAGG